MCKIFYFPSLTILNQGAAKENIPHEEVFRVMQIL